METKITIYAIITCLSLVGGFRFFKKMGLSPMLLLLTLCFPPLGAVGLIYLIYEIVNYFLSKRKKKTKIRDVSVLPPFTLSYYATDGDRIDIENPFRGIYIQGGAGSGKSETFIKPMIEQFAKLNISGILYDFKSPELSNIAYTFYKNNEYVSFAFVDFKNILKSDRINPISPKYLTKQSYAFEFAKALIFNLMPENIKHQDYWSKSSITLVAGIMWFLKKNYPQYCTIPHLVTFILNCQAQRLVEIVSSDIETAGMISSLREALEQNAGKQIAGVLGTLKNGVATLNIPEVFYILSKDDIDLNLNDLEKPTFMAIGNDSTLSETYAPIISLIITVCSKLMNQPDKCQSTLLLDEAPTLYIPNLEQIPATGRANKLITVFGAQDFTQIIDKYGQDKADSIISNLGTQFFGRTTNSKTAKKVSELFDKKDVFYDSYTSGKSSSAFSTSNNSGTSRSVQQRDVVKVRDVIQAKPGHFFGIIAEGNYKNILGLTFKLHKQEIEPIPIKTKNIKVDELFKKIHAEVDIIISNGANVKGLDAQKGIEKDIKLKSSIDITEYIDKPNKNI